jgi:hypothetical protein
MDYDSPFMTNERNDVSLVGDCRSEKGGIGPEDGWNKAMNGLIRKMTMT